MARMRQRGVGLLLVGAVLIASSGISLVTVTSHPGARGTVDSSDSFPCKYHGCGCVSAEMCRTRCCCVKPAAAVPAAKSCCSKKSAPASAAASGETADTGTSLMLVIQSASCAGRDASLMLKTVCWLVQFDRCEIRFIPYVERLESEPSILPDPMTLSFDPPPPRAC